MLHNVWFSNLLIFKGNRDKIIKLAVARAQGLCQWKRKEKVLFRVITTLNLSNSTGTTTLTFSYFHPVLRLMGMDPKFPKVLSLLWSEIYMMK